MPYPMATPEDVRFLVEHGWICIEDVVDPADLEHLGRRCDEILERRDTLAFDWAWEEGKERDQRDFRILQSSPTVFFPEIGDERFRAWAIEFASALMGRPVEFWYDQFLAKPPRKSATTLWHQDEAYWGRNLDDLGVTCWMPLHDVDQRNGCMNFIDGGHLDGVIEHQRAPGVKSDLLCCEPDESRAVGCPLKVGGVTFHHGKTPHMTRENTTDTWRRIVTQHHRVVGSPGEGDHHPWKIYVNQFTGERFEPATS
ncbi:MAG: phytanoyl-CoA dioxygenase family protein [Acidimicrobiales bacterium]